MKTKFNAQVGGITVRENDTDINSPHSGASSPIGKWFEIHSSAHGHYTSIRCTIPELHILKFLIEQALLV